MAVNSVQKRHEAEGDEEGGGGGRRSVNDWRFEAAAAAAVGPQACFVPAEGGSADGLAQRDVVEQPLSLSNALMVSFMMSGPPIFSTAIQEKIELSRRFAIPELIGMKLLKQWLEGSYETTSEAGAFFQQVAPYVRRLQCEEMNLFVRLIFRASALLSHLRVFFERNGAHLDADRMKIRLFSVLMYLDDFLRQRGGTSLNNALVWIERFHEDYSRELGSIRTREKKQYREQLQELQEIIDFLLRGLRRDSLLPVLLQPMRFQDRVIKKHEDTFPLLEFPIEPHFYDFFREVLQETRSIAQQCVTLAEAEQGRVIAALKKSSGKTEAEKWRRDFRNLLEGLLTYWIEPLKRLDEETAVLEKESDQLMLLKMEDVSFKEGVKKMRRRFQELKTNYELLCDEFDQTFNPSKQVMSFLGVMRTLFDQQPELAKHSPFLNEFESHWSAFIGRLFGVMQLMRAPLYLAEECWTKLDGLFDLRIESLFPEKGLVCDSQHIAEYNLIMGQMRACVRDLAERLSSDDKMFAFSLMQMINRLEEVFCDRILWVGAAKDDAAKTRASNLFRQVLDECIQVRLPALRRLISKEGHESIDQLAAACKRLREIPEPLLDGLFDLDLLTPLQARRIQEIEKNPQIFAFLKRDLETTLWMLKMWNKRPVSNDEVDLKLLQGFPTYMQMEIKTYIDQFNYEIRRFRGHLGQLQQAIEENPLTTEDDFLRMDKLLEEKDEVANGFDFLSTLYPEISKFLLSYDPQGAGRAAQSKYLSNAKALISGILKKVSEVEGFYCTSINCPNYPLQRWAQFTRLCAERSGAPVLRDSPAGSGPARDSSSSEEEVEQVETGEGEGGALEAEEVKVIPVSFQACISALILWVGRMKSGTCTPPRREDVERSGRRQEKLANLRFYLRTLEEWTGQEGLMHPLSEAKGILLNGAMMVEQTLKLLLLEMPGQISLVLLEKHSIGQLLESLTLSSRLTPEESVHLIHLGRFITEGSRGLSNKTNPQVSLLRKILKLEKRMAKGGLNEREVGQLKELLLEARQHVSMAFQSLAKLCGADIPSIFGSPAVSPDVEVSARQDETEPRKSDRDFQEQAHTQIEKMGMALTRRDELRIGHGIETGGCSPKVLGERRKIMAQSSRAISDSLVALRGAVIQAHQPQKAFTLSLSVLFESSIMFEYAVKSLMACYAMPQSTNPFEHILWESNARNGRPWLHEHRLFDLWKMLESHVEDKELVLTEKQEETLKDLNGFVSSHRYLGAQGGGLAPLFQKLAFLAHCYRQLRAGWNLPKAEQGELVNMLGSDEEQWQGEIQAEIHRIQEERIFPLVAHLLEATASLLEYQLKLFQDR